jgi:hypothetical protein
MTTAEAEGRARRIAGQEREERLDRERRQKAAKRQEAQEAWDWVCERFPIEKRSQACVSLSMLLWIHGKGNVTRAMVEARMRRQDERFGICDQSTSERS